MADILELEQAIEARFNAFRGVAHIGELAVDDWYFSERFGKGLELIGVEPYEAPEGQAVELIGSFIGFLTLQRRLDKRGYASATSSTDVDHEVWSEVTTRNPLYREKARFIPPSRPEKQVFVGKVVSYDHRGKVWVYDAHNAFRARVGLNTELSLIPEPKPE